MGVLLDVGPALALARRFHDIGKIAMPDALLNKPSPLTAGEIAIMRLHVDVGAEILDVPAPSPTQRRSSPPRMSGSTAPAIRWKLAGDGFRSPAASSPSSMPTTR